MNHNVSSLVQHAAAVQARCCNMLQLCKRLESSVHEESIQTHIHECAKAVHPHDGQRLWSDMQLLQVGAK